jgi:hypothetical protein
MLEALHRTLAFVIPSNLPKLQNLHVQVLWRYSASEFADTESTMRPCATDIQRRRQRIMGVVMDNDIKASMNKQCYDVPKLLPAARSWQTVTENKPVPWTREIEPYAPQLPTGRDLKPASLFVHYA